MAAYTHPLHLDPFARRTDPNATADDWRAEEARRREEGDEQGARGCGWIAWDLESKAAIARIRNADTSMTGPREITAYEERIVGPEREG